MKSTWLDNTPLSRRVRKRVFGLDIPREPAQLPPLRPVLELCYLVRSLNESSQPFQMVRGFNSLHSCSFRDDTCLSSIIKDGGDDPDCTHGAEIITEVRLLKHNKFIFKGGTGIATVTKPGLGLEVGGPAINPVPRKNIQEMIYEEIEDSPFSGAEIQVSVPDGAEEPYTINARLGLIGGISILGTTGVVLPYSTSAFIASIVQSIGLAYADGAQEVAFTTGGRSEKYAMNLLPHVHESGFIQVGDYIGIGIRNSIRHHLRRIHIVAMMGKLSKMADGRMMTHASASEVNMVLLARLAGEAGANEQTCHEIKEANTARHVLEICTREGISDITKKFARKLDVVA